MKLPSFVGLVGGKPGNAYYFCGLLESPTESKQKPLDKLIYLDPLLLECYEACGDLILRR